MNVECYSGYKGDERPVRFELSGRRYEVVELLDQWYGMGTTYFRIKADDGNTYILKHAEVTDEWTLEAFRRG